MLFLLVNSISGDIRFTFSILKRTNQLRFRFALCWWRSSSSFITRIRTWLGRRSRFSFWNWLFGWMRIIGWLRFGFHSYFSRISLFFRVLFDFNFHLLCRFWWYIRWCSRCCSSRRSACWNSSWSLLFICWKRGLRKHNWNTIDWLEIRHIECRFLLDWLLRLRLHGRFWIVWFRIATTAARILFFEEDIL